MSDVLNTEMLEELQAIMEDEFPSLLETFLIETQHQFSAVNEAWTAVDMDQLRRAAHTLKGSCANMGAEQLQHSCQTLETLANLGDTAEIPALIESVSAQLVEVSDAIRQL